MINNPEQVNKTIEQLYAKATLLDGEVVNLKKAKVSEQLEIQELLKKKTELEEQMEGLTESVTNKQEEINSLSSQIDKMRQKKADEQVELDTLIIAQEEIRLVVSKSKDAKEIYDSSLKKSKASLGDTTHQLKSKREKLKTLVDKLQEVLKASLIIFVIAGIAVALYSLTEAGQTVIANILD